MSPTAHAFRPAEGPTCRAGPRRPRESSGTLRLSARPGGRASGCDVGETRPLPFLPQQSRTGDGSDPNSGARTPRARRARPAPRPRLFFGDKIYSIGPHPSCWPEPWRWCICPMADLPDRRRGGAPFRPAPLAGRWPALPRRSAQGSVRRASWAISLSTLIVETSPPWTAAPPIAALLAHTQVTGQEGVFLRLFPQVNSGAVLTGDSGRRLLRQGSQWQSVVARFLPSMRHLVGCANPPRGPAPQTPPGRNRPHAAWPTAGMPFVPRIVGHGPSRPTPRPAILVGSKQRPAFSWVFPFGDRSTHVRRRRPSTTRRALSRRPGNSCAAHGLGQVRQGKTGLGRKTRVRGMLPCSVRQSFLDGQ